MPTPNEVFLDNSNPEGHNDNGSGVSVELFY